MIEKAILMDEESIKRTISRISHEIIERNKNIDEICLVGIITRGYPLAKMIKQNIDKICNTNIKLGKIDITFYRDDLSKLNINPIINKTDIDFDIFDKNIILVDDVIFTGRTARAAIEALLKINRPKTIQLAVLIDRGHRELPIRADYVGKNIPTSRDENIKVFISEIDSITKVGLYK